MKWPQSILFVLVLVLAIEAQQIDYSLFRAQVQANRLIVVTEPNWCFWCKILDPHLKQLKKEGYGVYRYTRAQWNKAKPKPSGAKVNGVPTIMYVEAHGKVNKVVKTHSGGHDKTAEYIKKYLTK